MWIVPQTAELAWKTLWKEIVQTDENYQGEERTDTTT
jgi:hypothetical protein